MITLERFGCEGNGVSVGRTARSFGVGNGTVVLYTNRVIKAILSLRKDMIQWPDEPRRREISQRFEEEFDLPGCIGVIDGTHFNLSQRPAIGKLSM